MFSRYAPSLLASFGKALPRWPTSLVPDERLAGQISCRSSQVFPEMLDVALVR